MQHAYPAPERQKWATQIEFMDGTTINATSDEDAIDRWRRVAAWTDPTALTDPDDWMQRILDRARTFYSAPLVDVTPTQPAPVILDALAEENCLIVRRR